jgi:L-threonylcarbamoyladenylate synthase
MGLESTVLDICNGQLAILRPGAVPKEAIEALIGPVASGPATTDNLTSPGLLKSHYAPRTPLFVHDTAIIHRVPEDNAAFLFFDGASRDVSFFWKKNPAVAATAVLSETGNLLEAAARLFDILHELDRSGFTAIHAQLAPEEGLGVAINDRLRRAASPRTASPR